MLLAFDANKKPLVAVDADKSSGPFSCPTCGNEVRLRRPDAKVDHFFHYRTTDCPRSGSESEFHIRTKLEIYKAAQRAGIGSGIEVAITPERIADVALVGKNRRVVVEIQCSPIGVEDIDRRMILNAESGYSTLWIVEPPGLFPGQFDLYKTKKFVRDIHNINGGLVCAHLYGLKFKAFHLMGYRFETWKYWKQTDPFLLKETWDRRFAGDSYSIVTPPARSLWWEKPKYNRDTSGEGATYGA